MSWYSDFVKFLTKVGKTTAKTSKAVGKEMPKAAKTATAEAKEVANTTKGAVKGVESGGKAGGELVPTAGRSTEVLAEGATVEQSLKGVAKKTLKEPAKETAVKGKGFSGWFSGNFREKVQTAKNVAQIPFYAAAAVPALAIGASSTKSWIEGNGILHGAMIGAFGQDTTDQIENNGIAGGAKSVLFGGDYANDAIAPALVKNIFGDDCIENVRHGCQNLMNSMTSGSQPEAVPQVIGYDANGQPIYGVMPDASMMQPTSSPFGSINNMVSNITGGKLNTMNALELIAAAYMMFSSRFGWMGKIGSILLGGNVAKDMQARQQAQLQSQLQSQQMMQQQVLMPQMLAAPMYQEPALEEENVVTRMRR